MKGFISAVGEKDSLGRDRVAEIRGLVKIGGKPVVFREVHDNTLAVMNPASITNSPDKLNFGRCLLDSRGKVISASHSFDPRTRIKSGEVIIDLYLFHPKRASSLGKMPDPALFWYKDFYGYQVPQGSFWADVGKPELRKKAEEHFR
jgi:hypothetical protein